MSILSSLQAFQKKVFPGSSGGIRPKTGWLKGPLPKAGSSSNAFCADHSP